MRDRVTRQEPGTVHSGQNVPSALNCGSYRWFLGLDEHWVCPAALKRLRLCNTSNAI
jgi:hypothetical protein